MKFRSTRGTQTVGLDDALRRGIANDGGLFLPTDLPRFSTEDFAAAHSASEVAHVVLEPFFRDSSLVASLGAICAETFSFALPMSTVERPGWDVKLLELFHGPTAAFKDVGAGFLAACLTRLHDDRDAPMTILVATSGDTGGAVASAFDGRPEARVAVLYPAGRVSPRQAQQLTCWSDNVLSLEVDGSFDDCQATVKAAFADADMSERHRFSSANSINIGRLLPQSTYYAYAALQNWRRVGNKTNFIVPTGNLGNALACVMARDMGLPIGEIVLATNANRLIGDYLDGAEWLPRASIETLATAMDVGNPSNMERLRALHGEADELRQTVSAVSVSDADIEATIQNEHREYGLLLCPHTATAMYALRQLADEQGERPWVVVATAHAAKFETVVEPLIGAGVPVPETLAAILSRPRRFERIAAHLDGLSAALDQRFSA